LAGGATERSIQQFQDLADAAKMTKDLNDAGIKALAEKLVTLGIALDPTTIGVEGLTKAIAQFFGNLRDQEDAVDVLKDVNKTLLDLQNRAREAELIKEGLAKGLTFDDQFGGTLDPWVKGQLAMESYRRQMEATGVTAGVIRTKLAEMQAAIDKDTFDQRFIERARQLEAFRQDVAQSLAESVASIVSSFGNVWDAAKKLVSDLARLFTEQFITKPLMSWFSNLLGGISIFKAAGGGLVKAASGGYIRGPGSEKSDSIPAMLSDKEFVFNAQAVRKWGVPMLAAMNSGKTPKFAAGGYANDQAHANNNGGAGSRGAGVSIGRLEFPGMKGASRRERRETSSQAAAALRQKLGQVAREGK
jgi:hypothetical protein